MGADLSLATNADSSEDFIRAFVPSYNPADNLGQQSLLELVRQKSNVCFFTRNTVFSSTR
jgi:hypothetical protein